MKIPITYIIGAFIFGLVLAFGIAAATYHPSPVQVQINQYVPVKAPEPAVPTIAPAVTSTGKFDPAPAPVVVTTMQLPSITPEVTPNEYVACNPNDMDPTTLAYTNCMASEMAMVVVGIMPLMVVLAVAGFVFSFIGGLLGPDRWR
jgi:hypothetical protein